MHLRKSRVLRKMRNGEVAVCTKLNLADPRVAEIASMFDFDCIWIDLEHVDRCRPFVEAGIPLRSLAPHGRRALPV